jgi:deazaflavin-dependent oxidoreductase (nitroreductase family)
MTDKRWRAGDPVDWQRPGELWTAGGLHAFVVASKGAQSGRTRLAVLGYLEDGPDAWLVIGSKGGAPTDPAWVHNLEVNESAMVVMADGTRVPVRASRLHESEGDRAWERLATEAPEYPAYWSKTNRPIPIIRLRREES